MALEGGQVGAGRIRPLQDSLKHRARIDRECGHTQDSRGMGYVLSGTSSVSRHRARLIRHVVPQHPGSALSTSAAAGHEKVRAALEQSGDAGPMLCHADPLRCFARRAG